jgi:protein-arginine kinase activator protein McsA
MSKVRCKHCGDIIESKSVDDWVCCSCFDASDSHTTGIFIDGGNEYFRHGGNLHNMEMIEFNNIRVIRHHDTENDDENANGV